MAARDVILGDWGTSRLRLYLVHDGAITARSEGSGIGQLSQSPEATLAQALHTLPDTHAPVLLCGMAGSRTGIVEAAYADCPATFADWVGTTRTIEAAGRKVTVAGGLAMRGAAADVMRGEETQIFGALALDPSLQSGRHRLLLPGTHSKSCVIEAGTIIGFKTYFTGELFALLSRRSTLLALEQADESADEPEGFAAGVRQAAAGGSPLDHLFEARARQLLDGKSAVWAREYLSGLLIGAELMSVAVDGKHQIRLIGDRNLCGRYVLACDQLGIAHAFAPGDECVIAGLSRLAARIEEGETNVD